MPQVIIYDFDGTIADTLHAAVAIYNRMAHEKGFRVVDENNLEFLRGKEARAVLKELGMSMYQVPSLILRGRRELKHSIENLRIFPGMGDLLNKLKSRGYKQGILTSNSEENVRAFLRKNAIDIFDFIHSGSIFGKGRALKKTMKENHFAPQEVIYVGDETRDIEAAKSAGVKIVSVSWGYNSKEVLEKNNPDWLISRPEELLEAVQAPLLGVDGLIK